MGTIYDYGYLNTIHDNLYNYIQNEIGVIALMANLYAESRCSPNRLQGDTTGAPTSLSINYTNAVNDLSYSRNDFITDSKGYGLAQWTIQPRKRYYYDYVNVQSVGIGDIQRALGYLHAELRGDYISEGLDYTSTLTACQNATDLHTCTDYVLDHFENPAVPNYTEREEIAESMVDFAKAAIENGAKAIISVKDWAVINIHNEATEDVDYTNYLLIDDNGNKYYTGSVSLWNSFTNIYSEMKDSDEEWAIELNLLPSKNYKGKEILTCSLV